MTRPIEASRPMPALLALHMCAILTGCTPDTFRRLARSGQVGPERVRFGKHDRYMSTEFMAWLNDGAKRGQLLPRDQWREVWKQQQASK